MVKGHLFILQALVLAEADAHRQRENHQGHHGTASHISFRRCL